MASLELRTTQKGYSWRIVFRCQGKKGSFTLPTDDEGRPLSAEKAKKIQDRVEVWLRLIKRRFVKPKGDVSTFLAYDGQPPGEEAPRPGPFTLGDLYRRYGVSSGYLRLSPNTQRCQASHFKGLFRLLGEDKPLYSFRLADLQGYVDRRSQEKRYRRRRGIRKSRAIESPLSANTIKHELKTLRQAWLWAKNFDGLTDDWPLKRGIRLSFPKTTEKLPFMTLDEAKQLFANGQASERVFHAIYLRHEEVEQLLEHVRKQRLPRWVYPLFVFAAHTGARRSEMLRTLCADVRLDDQKGGMVRIRENKRDHTKATYRTVPLTPRLREALTPLLDGTGRLFVDQFGKPLTTEKVGWWFHRALRRSPWSMLRGWHLFRHTFRSLLTSDGIDERVIDGLLGHMTDEQRRRYRHLYPHDARAAVCSVFEQSEATATSESPSDSEQTGRAA